MSVRFGFGAGSEFEHAPAWATAAAAATVAWIEDFVVGRDMCPFAGQPLAQGRVSVQISDASNGPDLVEELEAEALRLHQADPLRLETTLLVHPRWLPDFEDHNDFLDVAEGLLVRLGLEERLQIVGFHPEYRFADAPPGDPANATNRSPWPMLHLLRVASVGRAIDSLADPDEIWRRNVAKLRAD